MWDRLKKKIENFIWKEVDDNQDRHQETMKQTQSQDIRAKMVYQYPEDKPFRFPVIPDSIDSKKSGDIPAFQRRNKRSHPSIQKEDIRKVYKKDMSMPFKPTDVASPIYGYQQRKKSKDVENIPAYLRKQQKTEENSAVPEHESPKDQPENKVRKPLIQNESDKHYRQKDVEQHPNITVHQPIQMKKKDPKADNKTYITKSKPDSTKESISGKQPGNRKRNKSKAQQNIPYNVMMTPRDKKIYLDQKKVEVYKEENSDELPPNHLLNDPVPKSNANYLWVQEQQVLLEKTLKHFNVRAKVVHATQGPSVTRFEVQPELGVKVSRVRNLSDDLKLNLAAQEIRIEAPIPGKNAIGIEIPNPKAQSVGLQEIFETAAFKQSTSPLTIALGLSIEGSPVITNIQKMPHGLIAGATGSGKSVCINTILVSLLYKASAEDVKFLLIDPKMVELAPYNGIPHLVAPVITDVKAATAALKWAVNEMEERYNKFVQESVRDVERFNQKMLQQGKTEEKMPYIVIVIDELADLMMVSPQDVEDAICRIAQKARACGIHLLLATQRPSVDVITGLIKANIPTRIAFSVSSQVDSRTIIDTGGAEKLLGKGDMLFIENGAGKSVRLQGPFVSDEEIERVTSYARNIAPPNYLFEQDTLLEQMTMDEEEDELLQDAIQFILQQNSASTSLLQRHFKIGYNRAARLIDTLENRGIITAQNGSKPRDVLVTKSQLEEMYG